MTRFIKAHAIFGSRLVKPPKVIHAWRFPWSLIIANSAAPSRFYLCRPPKDWLKVLSARRRPFPTIFDRPASFGSFRKVRVRISLTNAWFRQGCVRVMGAAPLKSTLLGLRDEQNGAMSPSGHRSPERQLVSPCRSLKSSSRACSMAVPSQRHFGRKGATRFAVRIAGGGFRKVLEGAFSDLGFLARRRRSRLFDVVPQHVILDFADGLRLQKIGSTAAN